MPKAKPDIARRVAARPANLKIRIIAALVVILALAFLFILVAPQNAFAFAVSLFVFVVLLFGCAAVPIVGEFNIAKTLIIVSLLVIEIFFFTQVSFEAIFMLGSPRNILLLSFVFIDLFVVAALGKIEG